MTEICYENKIGHTATRNDSMKKEPLTFPTTAGIPLHLGQQGQGAKVAITDWLACRRWGIDPRSFTRCLVVTH